jgi:hypothetical protein
MMNAAGLSAFAQGLAWTPLLEPMPLDDYWLFLLIPLAIAISVVYKAIRMDRLDPLPRNAAYMAAQILVFLVAAAAVLWVLTRIV